MQSAVCIDVEKLFESGFQRFLMIKSRANPKNRFFRHIPGSSGRKKVFLKIGLRHILGIAILHHCAKNHENLSSIT